MDKIASLLKNIETLPASPALLPKLTHTLNDLSNTNVHEIVDIIMFDAALTAKLLQIANSVYFGNKSKITDVGEAISQVGYDAVFLLAASISGENTMKLPPGTGLDAVLLWKHSVTTAFGAQHVAEISSKPANVAFTAGILHDLGKIAFAEVYAKDYTAMLDPSKRGPLSLVEWELRQYGCHHAEVGAALLEQWKLPKDIVGGVRFHHHLSAAGENAPLAASICLGNALSRALEKPTFELEANNSDVLLALKILNLTDADLGKQWTRIRQKWEFVQTLCQLRKN